MRQRGRDSIAVNALSSFLNKNSTTPIPVEEQVAVMWAMQNGYLDAVPVDRVKEYQLKLQDWLQTRKASLLQTIREKKEVDKDLEAQMKAALDEFKTTWR
jgi:F0F1-type ATP synthase, alpha subunit